MTSLAGLTADGKAYASELLNQVKTGIHQYYLDSGGFSYKMAAINGFEFTVLQFFFCIAAMVIISLLTKAPTAEQLKYTYGASTPEERAATKASWNGWDIVHTIIILSIIIAFYFYFW